MLACGVGAGGATRDGDGVVASTPQWERQAPKARPAHTVWAAVEAIPVDRQVAVLDAEASKIPVCATRASGCAAEMDLIADTTSPRVSSLSACLVNTVWFLDPLALWCLAVASTPCRLCRLLGDEHCMMGFYRSNAVFTAHFEQSRMIMIG